MKELFRWMEPGLGVKRWVILILFGLVFVALGFAIFLVQVYKTVNFPGIAQPIVSLATGQHLPHLWRAVLLVVGGSIFTIYGTLKFQKTFLEPFLNKREKLFDTLKSYYKASRGPRIVTIGGGTGMSLLLRGLKQYTNSITAIVTVADSGGSSGRLRKSLGVLPPGDIRQNIIALSDTESLMAKLFDYRFEGDRYGEGLSLEGQNFGNLFLVAMNNITGDFVNAIKESSHILAVSGQVLPSTTEPITLCAELENGNVVREEENIDLGKYESSSPIKRLFLEPEKPQALPEAIEALSEAEIIILGPGDLYTSLLPNLLVPGVVEAIRKSSALTFYVCNVANKPTETKGFTAIQYLQTIVDHVGYPLADYMLLNNNFSHPPKKETTPLVTIDKERFADFPQVQFVQDDFIDPEFTLRHDPAKIAEKVMHIFKDVQF